ncbi:unnamed protein product [Fusarium equiseti]|uniref:MARVEL domain-containing protein n=1 Tax=Fusarium equiseti TaxID=61235 RepID=A0A8J2IN42_FUSEQ|nr:unnamed protein product [Fusarium equiseti]
MTAGSKIVTVVLRIAQLICGVVMVGIAGDYIATHKSRDLGHLSRFIYTVAVAAVSAFFAVIWLIPFSSNHLNYYIDAILGILSAGMAGWLIYSSETQCGKADVRDVETLPKYDDKDADWCTKWKALYVFAIISAFAWTVSALVGYCWLRKIKKASKAKYKPAPGGRRARSRF